MSPFRICIKSLMLDEDILRDHCVDRDTELRNIQDFVILRFTKMLGIFV